MPRLSWESEREAAIQAARRAGDVITEWAGRFTTRTKGQNDLVTEADLAAQTVIRETLLRKFPGDDFLGEEDSTDPNSLTRPRRWIVDPIDGTTNFVHGFPFFCVSIALEAEGEIVAAVILDPSRKECFSAARGQGSRCNSTPLKVSAAPRLSEAMVCVGLPAVPSEFPVAIDSMVRMAGTARSIRRMGSAALSLAYVAAGRSDGFVAHDIKPWDVAAGALLVEEAGGRITNLQSPAYNLYIRNILATNGLVHEEVQSLVGVRG